MPDNIKYTLAAKQRIKMTLMVESMQLDVSGQKYICRFVFGFVKSSANIRHSV